jgi:hypothetical protein
MSRSNKQTPNKPIAVKPYQFPNSRKLWHDKDTATPLLGCNSCYYRDRCGGLQVAAQIFDCMTFCNCSDPNGCDNVCPKNTIHLVARFQEVGGPSLESVPRVAKPLPPSLPSLVPMVYHSSARARAPSASVIAISLYELLDKRRGCLRFSTREALCEYFKISDDASIILSGTDIDPAIERWWRQFSRVESARALGALGITLVTAPNYSLFDDVPRLDNLFNMKRIAVAAAEIQDAGVPCAIHLNARTDKDWDHWIEYLASRPEYEFLAFEFGTGAGALTRSPWYVEQLSRLAKEVHRPLKLFVRGGLTALGRLSETFAEVTFIDTAAFVRAQRRRRGSWTDTGLVWEQSLTPKGHPVDDLFDANILAMEHRIKSETKANWRPLVHLPAPLDAANDAGNKPLKGGGLA